MNRGERGFTLIELMVALVVSSLLVGMILAIFSRMSMAYRGQQQIAGVQQVLAAARATIEIDAKQAGLGMAQGFKTADGVLHQAVKVINSSTGPDQVTFFYGDPATQAAVTGPAGWPALINVDSTVGFAINDLILLSLVDVTAMPGLTTAEANIAQYTACVLKVTNMGATSLTVITSLPWGNASQSHCNGGVAPTATSMVYKLIAHAYRIDNTTAAQAAIGPLQMSTTGGLLGGAEVWTDLAYGFTDLQTSLQVFHRTYNPGDSPDPDGDAERDWYSDAVQNMLTQDGAPTLSGTDGLLQISISLVARTDRDVEGISTAATPRLTDLANPANNTLGDHVSIPLPATGPVDPALQGSRIYRYTTFQVDFRNLGVGR